MCLLQGRLHADNSTGVASTSAPSKGGLEDLKSVSDADEEGYEGVILEPSKRPTGLYVRVRTCCHNPLLLRMLADLPRPRDPLLR